MPAPVRDNPHGDDFLTAPDDGRRYLVCHSGVGPHKEGSVISARDLGPGAQIPRLLSAGAVREVAAHEADLIAKYVPNDFDKASDPQWSTGNPHTEPLGKPDGADAPAKEPAKETAKPPANPPKA